MQKEVLMAQILEIAESSVSENEYLYIKSLINNNSINRLRSYFESVVSSVQRKLLYSIEKQKLDFDLAERYRIFKTLDNKITYICEELI